MTEFNRSDVAVWLKPRFDNISKESDTKPFPLNNNNSDAKDKNTNVDRHREQTSSTKEPQLPDVLCPKSSEDFTNKNLGSKFGTKYSSCEYSKLVLDSTNETSRQFVEQYVAPSSYISTNGRTSSIRCSNTLNLVHVTSPNSSGLPFTTLSPASSGVIGSYPGSSVHMKPLQNLSTRNCSNLIRSLAAKYNTSTNDNGYGSPLFPTNILEKKPATSTHLNHVNFMSTEKRDSSRTKTKCSVTPEISSLPKDLLPKEQPMFHLESGLPISDFPLVESSAHVFLSMMRNASVQVQQTQLKDYLKGTMKRPAESVSTTFPLDLSSSVAAKRQKVDHGSSSSMSKDAVAEVKVNNERYPSPTLSEELNCSSGPHLGPVPTSKDCSKSNPVRDINFHATEGVLQWTVDDVCDFIRSVDLCSEYAETFREHRIDGSSLPLLTEEHLTTNFHMKLGPALKLRSVLARKLGCYDNCLHCIHCHTPTGQGTALLGDRRPDQPPSSG